MKNLETDNVPWVEKYRPSTLKSISAHTDIIETIKKFVKLNKLPHLLFFGPPGTGKTSLILAMARQIYESKIYTMVLDLNASDDRGIHVVRQEIQDFASSRHILSKFPKLVILDECDSMTKDAQFALRRVIEKYTRNTRFCLICNYVTKIIPALQSRCTQFRFAPLLASHIKDKINYITKRENIIITKRGIDAVIRLSNGDMRRIINTIQTANIISQTITEDMIYDCAGIPRPENIKRIISWLFNATFAECVLYITGIQINLGISLLDIINEVQLAVTNLNISNECKIKLLETLSDIEYMLLVGSDERVQLASLIGSFIKNLFSK